MMKNLDLLNKNGDFY